MKIEKIEVSFDVYVLTEQQFQSPEKVQGIALSEETANAWCNEVNNTSLIRRWYHCLVPSIASVEDIFLCD